MFEPVPRVYDTPNRTKSLSTNLHAFLSVLCMDSFSLIGSHVILSCRNIYTTQHKKERDVSQFDWCNFNCYDVMSFLHMSYLMR